MSVKAGDKVLFTAPLSNGGAARWSALVVRVDGDTALVRHPARARTFPFSPVKTPGLYRYRVESLVKKEVANA